MSGNRPQMITFVLLAVLQDMEVYRVEVDAQTREDACREIVHQQMSMGNHVRSIRDAE